MADSSDLPAHVRIAYWLERLIVSRRVLAGDKLPSEVQLASILGVSRMTLRHALASVEAKGLLERRRGRFGGNFVAEPKFDFMLSGLPGFTEQMRRAHVEAGAHVVRAVTRTPPSDVRTALKLRRGDQVHEVIRVRSGNGEPVALEETYLPASVFIGMLSFDLTDSLYSVMQREYARGPYSADELVEPIKATPQQAELLNVDLGDVLLLVTRTSYSNDGTPVEFSRDHFRPDRTRILLRTHVEQGMVAEASPIVPYSSNGTS
ncbi:MAG: GntR family transcriptional regulator [Geodermatophilaceae bacterium]